MSEISLPTGKARSVADRFSAENESRSERVVLSCNHHQLQQKVLPGLVSDQSRLIQVPGLRLSSSGNREPMEKLLELLRSEEVEEVILCGHSMMAEWEEVNGWLAEPQKRQPAPILGRLGRAQNRLKQSKRTFIEEMRALLRCAEVKEKIDRDDFRVIGLFYLFESGIFLIYDSEEQNLVPYC